MGMEMDEDLFTPPSRVILAKWDPNQPRDRNGRWSGGSGAPHTRHGIARAVALGADPIAIAHDARRRLGIKDLTPEQKADQAAYIAAQRKFFTQNPGAGWVEFHLAHPQYKPPKHIRRKMPKNS